MPSKIHPRSRFGWRAAGSLRERRPAVWELTRSSARAWLAGHGYQPHPTSTRNAPAQPPQQGQSVQGVSRMGTTGGAAAALVDRDGTTLRIADFSGASAVGGPSDAVHVGHDGWVGDALLRVAVRPGRRSGHGRGDCRGLCSPRCGHRRAGSEGQWLALSGHSCRRVALVFTLPVYVLLFATTYFVMEHTAGSSFTESVLDVYGCLVLRGDGPSSQSATATSQPRVRALEWWSLSRWCWTSCCWVRRPRVRKRDQTQSAATDRTATNRRAMIRHRAAERPLGVGVTRRAGLPLPSKNR